MRTTSTYITLKCLRIYAYHGVMPQEQQVGAYFILSLRLKTNFSQAMQTDSLEGTVSYADVFLRVKEEMATPSRLLEHAAGRILNRLFSDFPAIESIDLTLSKENPPMGADITSAGIEIHAER